MADPPSTKPTVSSLLSLPKDKILATLGGIYEHSPWVAEKLTEIDTLASIATISSLAAAMKKIVNDSSMEQKMTLLKAHPDLCEKVEKAKELTEESQEEQGRSGLQSLSEEELASFTRDNEAYKKKFGIPFILAVRNATKYTVLSALAGRVNNTTEAEIVTAIQQVHKIAWMRLLSKIDVSDAQGFLTCHVLDTANGIPAAGMRIELHRIADDGSRVLLNSFVTNDDGRLEGGPALKGGNEFLVGVYEWTFYVGDYFCAQSTYISGTPFMDVVPLRFGIDNPDDHYHVPLLASPWSMSTYRGS